MARLAIIVACDDLVEEGAKGQVAKEAFTGTAHPLGM